MLTHVVLIKLTDPSLADHLAGLLNGLDGQIPGLVSISAGADVVRSERSWDLALVTVFEGMAAMEAYQTHPAHVAVATELRAAASELAAVDFEVSA